MNIKFWKNKNVVVTGGASFIGSHLCEELISLGANLKVIDNFTSGKLENLSSISKDCQIIESDCRSLELMTQNTKNCDVIFHLAAAHGGRGYIATHPVECSNNLVIDSTVFKAAHINKVDRVCFASSGCVYPMDLQVKPIDNKYIYLNEDMVDPFVNGKCAPDLEYGLAKLAGETALKAYNKQHGLKGVSCRFMVAYGERENESHAVIALIAKSLIGQDPFEIWGDGNQDRSFVYVKDIAKGLIKSSEIITDCSAINIGTDLHTKIIDLVKIISDCTNNHPDEFFFNLNKPVGAYSRAVDVSKMKEKLNWVPETSVEEGIKKTVDWYSKTKDIDYIRNNLDKLLHER